LEPLKTLQTRGILWSGGSDYPVTPLAARYGLWASTARQTAKGTYGLHPFGMAESVDIHAALRMPRVDQLGDRFHRAALKLGSSRTGSSVFAINNEYDVQTLMHALLATRFDDIRPEEWTPSYAGSFSSDADVNIMIINVQAFNARGKDARRIYEELDHFQSRKPIDVIRRNRPIMILDEPQKMEGAKTVEGLKEFDPLFVLRYSATHRKEHNKIHRLDALDAYNQKVLKKIAVRGVKVRGQAGTNAYLYLERIDIFPDRLPVARVEMEIRGVQGIRRERRVLGKGDNLHAKSGELDQYKGYLIRDLLTEGFPFDAGSVWLKAIGFGSSAAAKSEEQRQKETAAKELGFRDQASLERAKRFGALPPEEQERILAEREHSPAKELPEREPVNPERRAERVGAKAASAPDRRTEERTRSVSIGLEEVKQEAAQYLRQQYTNVDGEMICQICKAQLPFRLEDGNDYFEAVEFLPELTRRHYQNYLALCPNHSAMIQFANGSVDSLQEDFIEMTSNELAVVLAQKDSARGSCRPVRCATGTDCTRRFAKNTRRYVLRSIRRGSSW
jgi:hypothetical protein